MKNLLSNWKTTSAGFTVMITGVIHLIFSIQARTLTEADCTTTIVSIMTGIGLLAAGDASVKPPTT